MIHMFLIDSVGNPDVNQLQEYLGHWPEVIQVDELVGEGYMLDGIKRDPFTLAYLRLQNDSAKYEGKIYFAVRADYSRFPQIEGYIEHRVIPVIGEILDELCPTFGTIGEGERHDHFSEVRNTQYALYIYNADTNVINHAVSEIKRKNTMHFISTVKEQEE